MILFTALGNSSTFERGLVALFPGRSVGEDGARRASDSLPSAGPGVLRRGRGCGSAPRGRGRGRKERGRAGSRAPRSRPRHGCAQPGHRAGSRRVHGTPVGHTVRSLAERDRDLSWISKIQVNQPAVLRRARQIQARRTVKKEWQAAWLLKAVTCIDLTTLSGDDTSSNIQRLCYKAKYPVQEDLLRALNMHNKVATGFPAGQTHLKTRLEEIRLAVEDGAMEIDTVINRTLVLTGQWEALYDEIRQFRKACGEAHLKTILATGELGSLTNVYKASMIAMMAGSDFIKTSTGKETVNATFPVAIVMLRAIRDFFWKTGNKVGFKPAGGIRSAKDSLAWLSLVKEELGDEWLKPELFRIGASTLLMDIERQIYHHVTGRYAAYHDLPMS
ncbi:deoxyribose-phosphate aldolase isoform X2 [Manis javanica]|uniref:deoxyribose-phosphate aldolase isoform X2 n=1 Tax=Manis javanica TaxID=9974 RepID=UPI001879CC4E|nr:deoxyribose-phosphate aldolase isoform X2 [Manis javanica]